MERGPSELTFLPRGEARAVSSLGEADHREVGRLVTASFLSHSCQVPVMPKCFSLCFMYDQPGSLKACVRSGTCTDSVGDVFTGDLEARSQNFSPLH